MLKAFKFRLSPNGAQVKLFERTANACRFVYNGALSQRKRHYDQGGEKLSEFDQNKVLTTAKRRPGMEWLSQVPSQCLQQSIGDVAVAFKNFFEDLEKLKAGAIKADAVRYTRLHKKGSKESFLFPQGFTLEPKRIRLPKAGWVSYSNSRPIQGKPRSITVSKDGQHWFMAVLCEVWEPDAIFDKFTPLGEPVGIDLNVETGSAVALSNGVNLETAKTSKREWRFLRKLRRTISRRIKGSANWHKAVARLAKFEKFRANRRKDSIHKVTTYLANNHSMLVMEDLKLKNMTASAAGTVESPGKNVKSKAALNRVILDRAMGMFTQFLPYKCAWSGAKLSKRNPAYTSQRCSCCGHISKENRKLVSIFLCVKCGHTESAHTNAAKNVLDGGWTFKPASVCGENVRPIVGNLVEADTHRTEVSSC